MYCVACGTPLSPGLSYCNRCGASLKDRTQSKSNSIPAFLTAITVIAVAGMGIMLGGAVKLKRAEMDPELVGFFLLFSFIIILVTDVLLVRQLSRSNSIEQNKVATEQQFAVAPDVRALPARAPGEPIPSVTENTTRTLEYSRNQS